MIIVADSSPLISFAILEHLDILVQVFDEIIVPKAVFEEITMPDKPFSNILRESFINKTRVVKDQLVIRVLENNVDKGEAEAIALALENGISNILIDDNKGRKHAKLNGLQPIGTVGVLIQAKNKGLIPFIKPMLDKLILNEIRISEKLYSKALELAGEKSE